MALALGGHRLEVFTGLGPTSAVGFFQFETHMALMIRHEPMNDHKSKNVVRKTAGRTATSNLFLFLCSSPKRRRYLWMKLPCWRGILLTNNHQLRFCFIAVKEERNHVVVSSRRKSLRVGYTTLVCWLPFVLPFCCWVMMSSQRLSHTACSSEN